MPKKNSEALLSLVPVTYSGIQVNCCRNPHCENFQKDPIQNNVFLSDYYRLTGTDHYKLLQCLLCKKISPLKSNKAVHEELVRISNNLEQAGAHPCTNESCENHTKPFQLNPGRYHRNGFTNAGRQRVICKLCGDSFTLSDNRRESRRTKEYRDLLVFRMLVNQGHIKGIARVTELSPAGVYDAIERIWQQCIAFTAHRERKLQNTLTGVFVNVGTDSQELTVNWISRHDRRITLLSAISSVDNVTGYALAINVNFDDKTDKDSVEEQAKDSGDLEKSPHLRKFSRFWLDQDYQRAIDKSRGGEGYDDSEIDAGARLPVKGMLVHKEYTLMAHMRYLVSSNMK